MPKPLPLNEILTRDLADIRLAASTSFTAEEIAALDALLAALRRNADVRVLSRSPQLQSVARKVVTMKAALVRQRERRAAKAEARTDEEPGRLLDPARRLETP